MAKNMKHIDLFSGIGGFSLAFDTIFYETKNTHTFVEHDPFCQAVLRKHWPGAAIHGDIRSFAPDPDLVRRVHRKSKKLAAEGPHEAQRQSVPGADAPFMVTGGFPCQPFSQAGRRKGTADDRYLWPEMFRVICDWKPTWVIAENVRGLATWNDGLVLETVCSDLEGQGYDVQAIIVPAVAVGAPHRRDRVWIIAHLDTSNTVNPGLQGGNLKRIPRGKNDKIGQVLQGRTHTSEYTGREHWSEDWYEVATRLCGMDDGLPAGVDGLELSKAAHRVQRLKTLGNAIVPQVAMEIMKAIKETL